MVVRVYLFVLSFFFILLEVKLPYDPVCPSVSWLVGWLVCWSYFLKGREFHFHVPIGTLVIAYLCKSAFHKVGDVLYCVFVPIVENVYLFMYV